MSYRNLFLIVAFLPLLGACGEVVTNAPLGETPVAVSQDDWEGIWAGPDETYIIKVLDEETGTFLVSSLDHQKNPPEVDPMEIQLSKVGDWYFGNWAEEPGEFMWFRVRRDGESIVIWYPDTKKFMAAVDRGALPGKVLDRGDGMSDGKVFLGPLTQEHLDIITGSTEGVLFMWEEASPLFRVVGPERGGEKPKPDPAGWAPEKTGVRWLVPKGKWVPVFR